MADMTHQGPQTTGTIELQAGRRDQGAEQALSQLSVTPHFSEIESPRPPVHTSASVAERWGSRSYDTGVVIEGRILGREK